eukprot:GHVT01005675.1.p1 GENE.GHVT01005675.1~~GHVT01005675.1.p1  ORF type:complete len:425 (+),score=64.18 GHVT01005675.1:554-1828(+)
MRLALFAKAALRAVRAVPLGGHPFGPNTVIVLNDWHTALLPMYMRQEKHLWPSTRVCLLMHNLVYQGRFAYGSWMPSGYNLPEEMIESMRVRQPLGVGHGERVDCVNWLLGAVRYADRLLTVSPSYAREIMSDGAKGCELEQFFQSSASGGVTGILNGVKDSVSCSSEILCRAANLASTFDRDSLDKKRTLLKTSFQSRIGLPQDTHVPVFMFIGRLDFQKGIDCMLEALDSNFLGKANVNMQVVIIGQGREDLVEKVEQMQKKYPNQFAAEISFKGADKYCAYAGSDFALVPSRYEPCGLVQMEGMRFGVIPVVTPTGGLKDTVAHRVTGVVAKAEIDQESIVPPSSVATLSAAVQEALDIFNDEPELFHKMQVAALAHAESFTWTNAAKQYVEVFKSMDAKCVKHKCIVGAVTEELGDDIIS